MQSDILTQFQTHLKIKDYSCIYYNSIQKFFKYTSDNNISIENITYENVIQYLLYLKENKYSNGYINNLINALRFFYKSLLERGTVTQELLDKTVFKIKQLKTPRIKKDYITREELDDMIEMSLTFFTWIDIYKLKAILFTLFYTGLRKAEFTNLKRQDIDLKENVLIVRIPTKNKIERQVPFTKTVSKMMNDYFTIEGEEINAFNITKGQLTYLIGQLEQFLPDKKLTIHTFRHSFAKYLLRSGADITIIQKLMGHKDLNSTLIYAEPDEKMAMEAYRKLIK